MREPLDVSMDERGVVRVALNRPGRANSVDPVLARALSDALELAAADAATRALVLLGAGKNFCAGIDLAAMQRASLESSGANREDAEGLARLLYRLATFPAPVLALVQGGAIGLGVGLVASADIALAAEGAQFRFSEVRLGIAPALISSYVLAAMGARACRRYFLTAEAFSADEALRLGLVHEIVPAAGLAAAGEGVLAEILAGKPMAQRAAKTLIADMNARPPSEALALESARRLGDIRSTEEARAALAAFAVPAAPPQKD